MKVYRIEIVDSLNNKLWDCSPFLIEKDSYYQFYKECLEIAYEVPLKMKWKKILEKESFVGFMNTTPVIVVISKNFWSGLAFIAKFTSLRLYLYANMKFYSPWEVDGTYYWPRHPETFYKAKEDYQRYRNMNNKLIDKGN